MAHVASLMEEVDALLGLLELHPGLKRLCVVNKVCDRTKPVEQDAQVEHCICKVGVNLQCLRI